MSDIDVKIIASGFGFPEGPVAMPDGSVVLTEIRNGRCSRVAADGTVSLFSDTGGGPNGLALGPDGAFYLCNNGGGLYKEGHSMSLGAAPGYKHGWVSRLDAKTGEQKILYTHADGNTLSAPNDLVFDTDGGFWFTDLGKRFPRHKENGGVYYARPDGSFVAEVAYPILSSNGCGLSPDGKTLYVVETPTARLWAFDLSAPGTIKDANGAYRGEKGRVVAGLGGYQMFDSLAVDSAGHVCVATLITGAVSDISPDGQSVTQYKLPDPMVTNVCFGGPDLRTAYATLSMTGKLVSFEWPRPGLKLEYLNK